MRQFKRTFKLARCFTQSNNKEFVDFGFKDVKWEDKQKLVNNVFGSVANSYDLMNDLMSLGIHRCWKHQMVQQMGDIESDMKILDVAGGTGDVAFKIYEQNQSANVTVCDISESMLEVGRQKASEKGYDIEFKQANAEDLSQFQDNTFDFYTIAFGIRNVTDRAKALNEAYRVLRPGGQFFCLEFSQVPYPVIKEVYAFHRFNIIPWIGHFVANDKESYQYLSESIEKFPDQETFLQMIRDAGFKSSNYTNMTFGIVALHYGTKI